MVVQPVTSFISKSRSLILGSRPGRDISESMRPNSGRMGVSAFLTVLGALAALLVVGSGAANATATTSQWRSIVAQHSGKCLDISGVSQANGAGAIQWACHGGGNQQWVVVPAGNGFVQLVVQHSGQCLDVTGASHANGARVIQWPCHGGANQRWTQVDVGGGYFRLVAAHSGKCLDVSGASQMNGALVIQWNCHDGANQRWTQA